MERQETANHHTVQYRVWVCGSDSCIEGGHMAPQTTQRILFYLSHLPTNYSSLWQPGCNQTLEGLKVPCLHKTYRCSFSFHLSNCCAGPHCNPVLPYQQYGCRHLHEVPHVHQIPEVLHTPECYLAAFTSRGSVRAFDMTPGGYLVCTVFHFLLASPFLCTTCVVTILSLPFYLCMFIVHLTSRYDDKHLSLLSTSWGVSLTLSLPIVYLTDSTLAYLHCT